MLGCRGGEGSCGKRYGGCGGGKERCVGSEEAWGGVWESVWGEWGSVLACGERNGGGAGKCVRVWGPNTLPHLSHLTFPYISPYLPHTPTHFFTALLIPLPTSPLPPPTPQHTFLQLSPHLPSPSQSVAKLPCDDVSVAKLLRGSYHACGEACAYLWGGQGAQPPRNFQNFYKFLLVSKYHN